MNTAEVFEVGEAADYSQPAHESEAMRVLKDFLDATITGKVFIHT